MCAENKLHILVILVFVKKKHTYLISKINMSASKTTIGLKKLLCKKKKNLIKVTCITTHFFQFTPLSKEKNTMWQRNPYCCIIFFRQIIFTEYLMHQMKFELFNYFLMPFFFSKVHNAFFGITNLLILHSVVYDMMRDGKSN